MEKYKRQEVSPVEEENERDDNYKASNPQIDSERTLCNYHLIKPKKSYIEFINDRLSTLTLSRKLRSDAIYMNSFVVGSDGTFFETLPPLRQWQFFYDCTQFFADKYGKENIISAVVHVDETTPHLHLNIVPIVNGKLCSKDLFDKKKLSILQTEFHEAVGKKWELQRGIEGSMAKHLSTAELKAKTIIEGAEQQADETKKQARQQAEDYLQGIHSAVEAEINKPISKKKKQTEEEIRTLRTENAAYKEHLRIKNEDAGNLFQLLQAAERKNRGNNTAFNMVSDMISAYPDEFDALLKKSRDKKAGIPNTPTNKNTSGWSK